MDRIAHEKGSISYPSDIEHHGNRENSASPLPIHAYVHNTPSQPQPRPVANAAPLGFFSFASTLFVISMYDVQARSVTIPNAVIGMCCFVGGVAQFSAGMWSFFTGDMLSATAFSSYGGFWMAYATFLYPDFGITAAYAQHPSQFSNAVGLVLAPWFILTFIFLLGSLRSNLSLVTLFFLGDMTFMFLMISEFTGSLTVHKIGGAFGLSASAVSFYIGAALLLTEESSWFTLPLGPIRRPRFD